MVPFKLCSRLATRLQYLWQLLTLSAHRTKTLGRVLLDPGHETMLMRKSVSANPAPDFDRVSKPYGKSVRIFRLLQKQSARPV
jgi:hypothetical protein